MKQHIDKAYQAAIAIAAVLARTNGRANTVASEVLTDAKVIFDDGFLEVIEDCAASDETAAIERFKSAMMSSIEIAAWSRRNIETMIADDPVVQENYGAVWDDDTKYIFKVRVLAEEVFNHSKATDLSPESAWEEVKEDGMERVFQRAARAQYAPHRQPGM